MDHVEGGGEVEAEYLKARYKPAFEEALRVAMGRLPARARTVLRLHFADRLTVDGIAAFYKIGRSTAGRWLTEARDLLRTETARELSQRLGISPAQYASILALVRSRLDVSLGAMASDSEVREREAKAQGASTNADRRK
jgi:RNA polymerase sigma-70 factor (ECF subfamily)